MWFTVCYFTEYDVIGVYGIILYRYDSIFLL